jgi:type II secretory pathway component PulK
MIPGHDAAETRRGEEGIVLLLVLVLVVVAISTAYAMSKTALIEVLSTRQRAQHARAEMLARSGIALGERALQDDMIEGDETTRTVESPLDAWALLSAQDIVLPGDARLRITIRDAGGRLNLNSLVDAEGKRVGETSKAFLKDAIVHIQRTTPELKGLPGMGDEDVDDLADAILDWLDKDEETRVGTPEQEFYVDMRKAAAAPLNRPVFSLDELAGVPGLHPLLLDALAAYFTTQPMFPPADGGGANLNTAPPHVLGLIYHGVGDELELLDPRDVFELLKARDEGRVFCPAAGAPPCTEFFSELGLAPGEQIFPPLSFTGSVFRIESEARIGETRACVREVVDRTGGEMKPLFYQLGC